MARAFFQLTFQLLVLAVILAGFTTRAHAGDNFPGTTITGSSGSLTGSTTGATGEAGEPTTYGGGSLNTMWYSWTAPSVGVFIVETCSATQTNFDTTLKTYTGAAVNSLSVVDQNDDACAHTGGSLASRNTFVTASGTTYRIQVDGYGSNTGNFLLSWTFTPGSGPPPGDDFPGITLSGASGSVTGVNILATGQAGEPTTFGGGSLNTIWYSWTAPFTGTATFETCSVTQTDFDTTLKAYTGAVITGLTVTAQNDDACTGGAGGTASRVTFTATSGVTYRIQVDGYGSNSGNFLLTWSLVVTGPAAAVTKSASLATISAPGSITFTITVQNIGTIQLSSPSMADALTLGVAPRTLTSGPTYVSGDTNGNGQIGTSETWTWTASYTATQNDIDTGGNFNNTATFTSTQTGAVVSNTTVISVVQSPSLAIVKSADDATDVIAGQVLTYTYAVENTGNITIDNVSVADSHPGSGPAPSPSSEALTTDNAPLADSTDVTASNGVWSVLRPGDTVTFTGTYTVTQSDVDSM
ncbi:MAG: hypothetical protein WBO55_16105 [Rhizobiaceae bacterium]